MLAHIDVDAFFASVLVRTDPSLQGKPLLALGMGGGCVIAASYEAKAMGVKTGMRVSDARKICPGAIERISDFAEACRASTHIEEILRRQCPAMEKMSVDEWFLDLRTLVGGIPEDLGTWAADIQHTIQEHLALSVSVGIGPTKTIAKMASEYRKPAGVTAVTGYGLRVAGNLSQPETRNPKPCIDLESFLRDRPAAAIPGIGRRRMIHTEKHGWTTAWDFAHAPRDTVVHLFGRPGRELQQELLGTVIYPIQVNERPPQSISRCRSFRRTSNEMAVYAQLQENMTVTVMRMRREHLSARNLSIWLRNQDYHSLGAKCRLPRSMDTEEELLVYARRTFHQVWKQGGCYTQVGLALCNLTPAGGNQYSLFEQMEKAQQRKNIQEALDDIHERFGRDSVVRGPAIVLGRERKKRERTMVGDTDA
ncbi:MAG: DNA polymerase IV [Candidatus Peregrinibacteria bacterium Greene0416_62]|nr:MAG: DNA polymerase IV [Candidatus Peregrinibacteria bacterium Greene0416_62]TSC99562.1 MAG: DNA polymerase IV [Candidatus Peregrinibacteria bacterium Greene1014_49]